MGDQALRRDVVLVEPEVRRAHVEGTERLAGREPLELRNAHLDHEAPARLEVRGDVLEARDLLVLRRQVHDRVEDEVGDRERPLDRGRGEVADRHADVLGARLRAQSRDHRLREVDPVHADSALRERQRDPAGADPELERGAAPGELGEEIDGRIDDGRIEHVRLRLVVPRGDALAEVAVVVFHARAATAWRAANGRTRRRARPRSRAPSSSARDLRPPGASRASPGLASP